MTPLAAFIPTGQSPLPDEPAKPSPYVAALSGLPLVDAGIMSRDTFARLHGFSLEELALPTEITWPDVTPVDATRVLRISQASHLLEEMPPID